MSDRLAVLILTHQRPKLVIETVRVLQRDATVSSSQIVVVDNARSLDPSAEPWRDVGKLIQTEENVGPAGGYDLGLSAVRRQFPDAEYIFVAEDDLGAFDVDDRIVSRKLALLQEEAFVDVGAIVSYGREMDWRTGRSVPTTVSPDVAAWGGTLVRTSALEGRQAPVPEWFFGYEDFDFFLDLAHRGWRLAIDPGVGSLSDAGTEGGRQKGLSGHREVDDRDAWREYYRARNFVFFAEKWGTSRWKIDHVIRSARRVQLAPDRRASFFAVMLGLYDGFRGRSGRNDRYLRRPM